MTPDTSLYFHIPFCVHRCAYCDFNTYAGQEFSIPAYVDALRKEIEDVGDRAERSGSKVEAHTTFFGGGTPSLLSPAQFELIYQSIRENFNLREDAENSIEANPGTVSLDDLKQLRKIGINRISFGVQSANTEELRMLERIHDFFTVIEAVSSARKAGFDRQSYGVNLDLIYGLPEQTLRTWQTTLQRIVDLHPEHISAYALTLEHGTPFGRWSSKGLLPIPDPDLAADMYDHAEEFLESNGYVHYEISNWAVDFASSGADGRVGRRSSDHIETERSRDASIPSYACLHNLQYWRALPYLAFGAGAHGYADGYRYSNVLRIKTYIDRMNSDHESLETEFPLSPATVNQHKQTIHDEMSEFMMTGLRLTNAGVTDSDFRSRFGHGLFDIYPKEIEELLHLKLLEWSNESLRLTKRGRLLGNQAFMRFI